MDSRILDYGIVEGSIRRMNTTIFRGHTEWGQVLRFIIAALLALAIAYGTGLTGGLITVIAVLFMPVLPHSPRLAVLRFGSVIVGFGFGWIMAFQFVDQPWLLFAVLMANAFFWFYMMATGLPFLTMIVLGLMPVLVGWMVYAGKTPQDVYFGLGQFLCGIFAAEVVSLLWPNTAATRIRKSAAASIRQFSDQVRTAFTVEKVGRTQVVKANWMPSLSLGFNNLLAFAREENGDQSREYRRLTGLVENVRHLVAWPKVYSSFLRSGRFDQWMVDMREPRKMVHEEIYKSMEALANAVESGRPAEDQTGLENALAALDDRSRAWLLEHEGDLSLETISLVEARIHYAEVAIYRIKEIVKFTRGEPSVDEVSAEDLPAPSLASFTRSFDPKIALFALKSVLCVFIGFVIASVFPNWNGSLIILLMSGFLAPLTVGGLTVNFIDRIWGLVLAGAVGVFVITVLMPDLVEVGQLLLVVGICMIPGAILALNPKTSSMGLSYSMGLLFMLTSSPHPSASLDPIQERLVSVGGATLICYLVFRSFIPSKSSDLVTTRLKAVFLAVAELIEVCTIKDREHDDLEWSAKRKRHAAVRASGAFDQLAADLDWESAAPQRVIQVRRQIVELVNGHLLLVATNSHLSLTRDDSSDEEIFDAMNATLEGLGDVEARLADVAESVDAHVELGASKDLAAKRLAHEREVLLRSKIIDRMVEGGPRAARARVLLTEYAHHCTLHQYQQKIYRALQLRDILHDATRTEFFGRTT